MDLVQLRYFRVIAEEGSMTRAARVLRVSQPTLTVAIRNLEQSLRTILFHRARNGVQLTATGRELLEQTRDILAQLDVVEQRIHGLEEQQVGSFVIGCHPSLGSYFLPRFLETFWREDSRVELAIWTGPSPEVWHRVIARDVHFGLVVNPKPHPDLVVVELFRDLQAIFVTDAFFSMVENASGTESTVSGTNAPGSASAQSPELGVAAPDHLPTRAAQIEGSADPYREPSGPEAMTGDHPRIGKSEESARGGIPGTDASHALNIREHGDGSGRTDAPGTGASPASSARSSTEQPDALRAGTEAVTLHNPRAKASADAGSGHASTGGGSGGHPEKAQPGTVEITPRAVASASLAQALLRRGPVAYAERFDQSRELLRRLNVLGCAPSRTISCGDYELVKSLTAAGLALGILPERVARYGYGTAFRPLHPDLPAFDDKIKLIYRADLHRTRAAMALKEALVAAGRQMGVPESAPDRS